MIEDGWMKHPFWIVNSALILFVLLAIVFVYFSGVMVLNHNPNINMLKGDEKSTAARSFYRVDIEPDRYTPISSEQQRPIFADAIYEQDLFGTYRKEQEMGEDLTIQAIPEPPAPQPAIIPEIVTPQFLDPLNITLKGIVTFSYNDDRNSAIIEDNKPGGKELAYRVGDTIEDAQIVRILSNKIILLRSNGQQEILYLREQDAKSDPAFLMIDDWGSVVEKIGETSFLVDPKEFGMRVRDISTFIDLLSVTTAYKDGRSVGSRIGRLTDKSLGTALGFITGDIIESINNIPATSTSNRLQIYKGVLSSKLQDVVTVTLLRDNNSMTFTYTLREFNTEVQRVEKGSQQTPMGRLKEEEKVNILKEKYKFAPTMKEIRSKEKDRMLNFGKNSAAR